MHEVTQRRLLRIAFVILCLGPTLTLLGWTTYRSLPLQTRKLEHQLEQLLGVRVQIERREFTRPEQLTLINVVLTDVESGRQLAQAPKVIAQATDQGWQLAIAELTMNHGAPARLWEHGQDRLFRHDELARQIAHLHVSQLSLEDASGTLLSAFDLDWARSPRPNVQRSRLFLSLQPNATTDGVRIDIERDRSGLAPATRLDLDTGNLRLPFPMIAAALGRSWPTPALLQGQLQIVFQQQSWRATFAGQLADIPLAQLSPDWIHYPLEGSATLNVRKTSLDAHGLQMIDGWLQVEDFAAPQELIQSLIRFQLFAAGPAYEAVSQQPVFETPSLTFSLFLGEMGLVCKGIPDEAGLPVAASSDAGILLLSQGHKPVNFLICALVPEHAENVYQARGKLVRALPATLPRLEKTAQR